MSSHIENNTFAEQADVISVLKGILKGYSSNSILREFLQNSDDAKATTQTFILDKRTHRSGSLFDPALADTQGPALLAINDTAFAEDDWVAIRSIRHSSKGSDEKQTGKYGIGFRSSYHVTDHPQILSNDSLVVLDPQQRCKSFQGGKRVNFVSSHEQYKDQLSAFSAVLHDFSQPYHGTIIRLPLRTEAQAKVSALWQQSTSVSDVRKLFRTFVDNEMSIAPLFLRHVKRIKLMIMNSGSETPKHFGEVGVDVIMGDAHSYSFEYRHWNLHTQAYEIDTRGPTEHRSSKKWRCIHAKVKQSDSETVVNDIALLLAQQSLESQRELEGDGDIKPSSAAKAAAEKFKGKIRKLMRDEKLHATMDLAMEMPSNDLADDDVQDVYPGRLFTLLPLPIKTRFPLHVNGFFALTEDRQNLKNENELGISDDGYERFLVSWNRYMFRSVLPMIWVQLWKKMAELDQSAASPLGWSILPLALSSTSTEYWRHILKHIVHHAIEADTEVFPLFVPPREKGWRGGLRVAAPRQTVAALREALVATNEAKELLTALIHAGVWVVQLPDSVQDVLPRSEYRRLGLKTVQPRTVHASLQKTLRNGLFTSEVHEVDKTAFLEFLSADISPTNFNSIFGLPIIPLSTSGRGVLQARSPHVLTTMILVSDVEAALFSPTPGGPYNDGDDNRFVKIDDLPKSSKEVFCSSSAERLTNVELFGPEQLAKYFEAHFGEFVGDDKDAVEIAEGSPSLDWWNRFWAWLDQREDQATLLPLIKRYHIIPSMASSDTLLRASSNVFMSKDVEASIRDVFMKLEIPLIHPKLSPPRTLTRNSILRSTDDLAALLKSVDTSSSPNLTQEDRKELADYLNRALRSHPNLNPEYRQILTALPIFRTRVPYPHRSGSKVVFGEAKGKVYLVRLDDICPIPELRSAQATFVDVAEHSTLASSLHASNPKSPWSELQLLEFSINHLAEQGPDIQDALALRIVPRLLDMPDVAKNQLKYVTFLRVQGRSEHRAAPVDLIDPLSPVAELFSPDEGKLPASTYSDAFIAMLQAARFFQTTLTPEIIIDRIAYLHAGAQQKDHGNFRASMARTLLELLQACSLPGPFSDVLKQANDQKWIPIQLPSISKGSPLFCKPYECRPRTDLADRYLWDKVLETADITGAVPAHLREVLGWTKSTIPLSVVKKQLEKTLALKSIVKDKKLDRLIELIGWLARCKDLESEEEGRELEILLDGKKWVPCLDGELSEVSLVILASDVRLGHPFRRPAEVLQTIPGIPFLRKMGCLDKPDVDQLLASLSATKQANKQAKNLHAVIEILGELANQMSKMPRDTIDGFAPRIFAPDHSGVIRAWNALYYDDSNEDTRGVIHDHNFGYPLHDKITKRVAKDLAFDFLSTLRFNSFSGETERDQQDDQDEDDDDIDMKEELATRIANVLKDYHKEYAFNEFLANAADAGATTFSVILDESRRYPTNDLLCPEMEIFQKSPALLLYNEREFSDNDFQGLRQVGRGGKEHRPDTIGRFGLGALSFFYFADVAFLVSGDSVLILDPTQQHLPPRKGFRRTALKISLQIIRRRYPDLLKPFTAHDKFSMDKDHFPGTLFRLPLRQRPSDLKQAVENNQSVQNLLRESYKDLAKNAFFFTRLEHITASVRTSEGKMISLWTFSAERNYQELPNDEGSRIENLTINGQESQARSTQNSSTREQTHWVVGTKQYSTIACPEQCASVLAQVKLDEAEHFTVRAAMAVENDRDRSKPHYLFSGLRLPQTSHIPLHVDAKFALSSDRRGIRFDPPTADDQRVPEAAYNAWIIGKLVPSLHQNILAYLGNSASVSEAPSLLSVPLPHLLPVGEDGDDISRTFEYSFWETFSTSSQKFLPDVSGKMVAPTNAVFSLDEPPEVGDVLTKLGVENFVVLSPAQRKYIMDHSKAINTVTPAFVYNAIVGRVSQLLGLFTSRDIRPKDTDAVLLYLLKGDNEDIKPIGLPLLACRDDTIVELRIASENAPFLYHSSGLTDGIFDDSSLLHPDLDSNLATELLDQGFNVRKLDEEGVVTLLRRRLDPGDTLAATEDQAQFIRKFCRYLEGNNSISAAMRLLGPFPLIETTLKRHFVSPNFCYEGGKVLPQPPMISGSTSLLPVLEVLRIPVIAGHHQLFNQEFRFGVLVQCLRQRREDLVNLTHDQKDALRELFCSNLPAVEEMERSQANILAMLPIWRAEEAGLAVYRAATQVKVLPDVLQLQSVSEFLDHSICFVDYSAPVMHVLDFILPRSPLLKWEDIIGHLQLPLVLEPNQIDSYSRFLGAMIRLPSSRTQGLKVPNSERVLKSVDELFDGEQVLFRTALSSGNAELFLHEALVDLAPALRTFGLIHQVDFNSFLRCARAIHTDVTRGEEEATVLLSRARVTREYYNEQLPRVIMANRAQWREIDECRFYERHAQRTRTTTTIQDPERYCRPLPSIVSPSQLVRERDVAVAWTQRGLFLEEPSINVVAVNQGLGVPTVEEVVQHLHVLATRIAQDYPQVPSVLYYLTKTYEWLNNHGDTDRVRTLLSGRKEQRLFLNVEDPTTTNWRWCCADELVLDLPADERALVAVRSFAGRFEKLLVLAGAKRVVQPDFRPAAAAEGDDSDGDLGMSWRRTAIEMREKEQMLDLELVPMRVDGEIEPVKLRAHSQFLAMTVPHFRAGLNGIWAEGRGDDGIRKYPFQGSSVCALAVLDFIYTGDFTVDQPQNQDEKDTLFPNLLELLKLADAWDMTALRARVEWLIPHLNLLSVYTCREVLDHAVQANAPALRQCCEKFFEDNEQLIRELHNTGEQ